MSALPRDDATARGAEVPAATGGRGDGATSRPSEHDFQLESPQLVELMCECGHSSCNGVVVMSLDEYGAVRLHPGQYLIKEGHEVADELRAVGYGMGYIVVAKERPLSAPDANTAFHLGKRPT